MNKTPNNTSIPVPKNFFAHEMSFSKLPTALTQPDFFLSPPLARVNAYHASLVAVVVVLVFPKCVAKACRLYFGGLGVER